MLTYEHCTECDARTGRAGRGEDSLYFGEDGPYCEDCYNAGVEHHHTTTIKELEAQLAGDREIVKAAAVLNVECMFEIMQLRKVLREMLPSYIKALYNLGVWEPNQNEHVIATRKVLEPHHE